MVGPISRTPYQPPQSESHPVNVIATSVTTRILKAPPSDLRRLTSKCAAGGVVVQCGTALPARPHHCKVGPLGVQKDGSLCSRGSELLTSFPRSNLASIFLTAFLTSTRIKNGPVITAKTKKARIGKTNAPQILHANSFVSTAPASFMMGTVTWYPQTPASGSVNHSAISSNHTYNATISLVSIFPPWR